jgi:hypothetical protein
MPLVTHAFAAGPVAETVREAYGAIYVLVQPDGYLTWRSETPGWVSDPNGQPPVELGQWGT